MRSLHAPAVQHNHAFAKRRHQRLEIALCVDVQIDVEIVSICNIGALDRLTILALAYCLIVYRFSWKCPGSGRPKHRMK